MSKEAIKEKLRQLKGNECELTGTELPEEKALYDAHRLEPKAEGGQYLDENTVLTDPVAHLKAHGNFKDRSEGLQSMKSIVDARNQVLQSVNAMNNRMLAFQRGVDQVDQNTLAVFGDTLKTLKKEESRLAGGLEKAVKAFAKQDKLAAQCLQIKGLGPITTAYMLIYIDLEKADTVSKLWSYAGLHLPSHQRYTKGETSGGNKRLRTALYTTAESMIKLRGAYRAVYDAEKERLAQSEKITQSRNTQGHLVELPWKDAKPSHRDGAAKRKMIKHLLADFLFVGRTLRGLPVRNVYAKDQLAHSGIVHPNERGWSI
jgi:hypothetical protein